MNGTVRVGRVRPSGAGGSSAKASVRKVREGPVEGAARGPCPLIGTRSRALIGGMSE